MRPDGEASGRETEKERGRERGTGSCQHTLIFCWVIDFLLLAVPSLPLSQSDSDESCPSGAAPSIGTAYFPPSPAHSSAMLCIQNAEISPGGFQQGIYCYRQRDGGGEREKEKERERVLLDTGEIKSI